MSEARSLSGRSVVAVFAHPDDEAIACGGTLARLADEGARVTVVCASRGELGSASDPALVSGGDLGRVRAAELEASARALGVHEVRLLSHADGCLRWSDALAAEIHATIAECRADAVITFDADGLYWHGDHIGVHEHTTRAVAALGPKAPPLYYVSMGPGTMRAVVEAARAHGGAPDGEGLWGISPDAFGVEAPAPTVTVDVRATVHRKLAAIRCHRTQLGPASPFICLSDEDALRLLATERFRRAPGAPTDDVLELLG